MAEGRLLLQIGEDRHELGPGSFAWVPRQVPHTFANVSASPVRLLGIAVPGGIEELFAEQAAYFARLQGPPVLAELAAYRRPARRAAARPADQRGRRGRSEPPLTARASSAADDCRCGARKKKLIKNDRALYQTV